MVLAFKLLIPLFFLSQQVESTNYVVELDDSNFNNVLANSPSLFVDFYAKWCGHCQKLHPIYNDLSVVLHDAVASTVISRIDAYTNREIKNQWSVSSYPTLMYYCNGELVEGYKGGRNVEELSHYIKEKEAQCLNGELTR